VGLTGAVVAATGLAGPSRVASAAGESPAASRPNVLLIVCDQLGFDAMGWTGCPDVSTRNLDRLRQRSVAFNRTHSPDPVCSPARGALFTGRMPAETGVIANAGQIRPDIPNLGQWLSQHGNYDTAYCGKWHLSDGWAREGGVPGFTVLPVGDGQGALVDHTITLSCEAYLNNRRAGEQAGERPGGKPFLLVASYMQPHDICLWGIQQEQLVPAELPFPQLRDRLPALPPNHTARPAAPASLDRLRFKRFKSDEQWRYYLYNYYRLVEQLDTEVGRLLAALDRSGQADNTVIIFTSDHGDGRARHGHVQKGYPYDEAVRVPLMVSWPGRLRPATLDDQHLVGLIDLVPTICDYAGIQPPPKARGRSLRPLLEPSTAPVDWRDHIVSQYRQSGRTVRTDRYKFVRERGDPTLQLFDLHNDPWETRNLYQDPALADVVAQHAQLLDVHEAALDYAPNVDPATLREKVEA
jgi:choline-sulfatase